MQRQRSSNGEFLSSLALTILSIRKLYQCDDLPGAKGLLLGLSFFSFRSLGLHNGGRALRLGRLGGRALRLEQARGPSAAARAGQGAERCG